MLHKLWVFYVFDDIMGLSVVVAAAYVYLYLYIYKVQVLIQFIDYVIHLKQTHSIMPRIIAQG